MSKEEWTVVKSRAKKDVPSLEIKENEAVGKGGSDHRNLPFSRSQGRTRNRNASNMTYSKEENISQRDRRVKGQPLQAGSGTRQDAKTAPLPGMASGKSSDPDRQSRHTETFSAFKKDGSLLFPQSTKVEGVIKVSATHSPTNSRIDKVSGAKQSQSCQQNPPSKIKMEPKGNTQGKLETEGAESLPIVTKKKQRKNVSKDERRRKREEKYYQALYQNKDSHIQFVSADIIRKLQSETPTSSKTANKKYCNFGLDDGPAAHFSFYNKWAAETSSTNAQTPVTLDINFPMLSPLVETRKTKPEPPIKCDSNRSPVEPVMRNQLNNEMQIVTDGLVHDGSGAFASSPPQPPTSSITYPVSKGKKSKQPMVIDMSALLITPSKRENEKKNSINVSSRSGVKENYRITVGNQLDSSGPGLIHRGKIRQKAKKPTKLKLTILKSRALRRLLVEGQNKHEAELGLPAEATPCSIETSQGALLNPLAQENVENTNDEVHEYCEVSVFYGGALGAAISDLEDTQINILNVEIDATHIDNQILSFHDTNNLPLEEEKTISLNEKIQCDSECIAQNGNESICKVAQNDFNSDVNLNDVELPASKLDVEEEEVKFMEFLDNLSMMKISEETISPDIESAVKASMHNRKFRDYCDMYTSKELHGHVIRLLTDLFRFQDRLYHSDPIKFKTKRRFISGLKDALSYLNLNKVQLLIIAPDIERNPEPGGLDEKVNQILTVARRKKVPFVFSGNKYIIGKPMKIKTPVSVVSVLDKQNCEETFQKILEEAANLREKYHCDFLSKSKELVNNIT